MKHIPTPLVPTLILLKCSLFSMTCLFATGTVITRAPFGETSSKESVELFTLRNVNGLEATVTNFGAILTTLKVPDRNGKFEDVVLGFYNLEGYENEHPYFGATVGRFAGRIAGGKFSIDGHAYQLSINNGPNHLHGGTKGFDKKVWKPRILDTPDGQVLQMTYTSPDGEEGYPGTLTCTATYRLTSENELAIDLRATTDQPTIINLTHHSYFNLGGYDSGDILDHELTVFADFYAPAEPEWLIPTGEILSVTGTSLDFRTPRVIRDRLLAAPGDMGGNNGGYDLNYALRNQGAMEIAARVRDPKSGRIMEVYTSEPALQVYTSNYMTGTDHGKGVTYEKYSGLCVEPEHFPNSPNQPHLPSTILRPGNVYMHTIIYQFSTDAG